MEIKDKELHRIAITAIIYNKDKKFLITKRSLKKKAFPGKWTVPGGGLSTDDYVNTPPSTKAGQWYYSVEKTLRREVKEEVNVEIGKPEYLLDLTFIIPDGTPCMVLSFYAPYVSGEELGHSMSKSSWDEYIGGNNYSFCDKDIVLDQFNKTEDYEVFANDSLKPIMQKKKWKIFYWNDMDIINLGKFLKEKGEKPYRLKQIKKRCLLI